jgi:hypothetical protein
VTGVLNDNTMRLFLLVLVINIVASFMLYLSLPSIAGEEFENVSLPEAPETPTFPDFEDLSILEAVADFFGWAGASIVWLGLGAVFLFQVLLVPTTTLFALIPLPWSILVGGIWGALTLLAYIPIIITVIPWLIDITMQVLRAIAEALPF